MSASISIIIPARNAQQWLGETVESVRAQTLRDWELLIVDDGSSDKTRKIATSFAGQDSRIHVVMQEGLGVSAARNAGIRSSSPDTPYIAFLDADDIWLPDTLETLVRELEEYTEAAGAHGLAQYIDDNAVIALPGRLERWTRQRPFIVRGKQRYREADEVTTFQSLAFANCMPIGSFVLRRSALEATDLFDETLNACEDWDLVVRIATGAEFLFVDHLVCRVRHHGAPGRPDRNLMLTAGYEAATRILASGHLSDPQRTEFIAARSPDVLFKWAGQSLSQGRPAPAIVYLAVGVRNLVAFKVLPAVWPKAREAFISA